MEKDNGHAYFVELTNEKGYKNGLFLLAENGIHAIEVLLNIWKSDKEFFAPYHDIVRLDISQVKDITEIDDSDRFLLQASKHKADKWICTDTKNHIVVSFMKGSFNETKEITFLDDYKIDNPFLIGKCLKEMNDYLKKDYSMLL